MASTTIQFISQVKLSELRRQRAILSGAYDGLATEIANRSPIEQLQILYDRLRTVQCAGKQLHPDLVNLEILLNDTGPSAEVVSRWVNRLKTELTAGRLRAEVVYLFGALLGEWGRLPEEAQRFQEERRLAHESLLITASTSGPPSGHMELFRDLFASFGPRLTEVRARIAELADAYDGQVGDVLSAVKKDVYQPTAIRQEANRFLNDGVLSKEFYDALRIHLRETKEWSWPVEGVDARTLWTRNKWRLYLSQDLPAFGAVHGLGRKWISVFEGAFGELAKKVNRRNRLQKLLDLKAPEVILANERRMLQLEEQKMDFGWYEPRDPWDDSVPEDCGRGSVAMQRMLEQSRIRRTSSQGYYAGEGYGGQTPGLSLIYAEVRALRAAYPDRPLFVAKADIENYFSSIPHKVLLSMLEGCGLRPAELQFFERFVQVPYRTPRGIVSAQRGVPMAQLLSHFLAHFLLQFLEKYIHQQARVRVVRVIDDICLLAPSAQELVNAWQATEQFLKSCGLRLNESKAGAVAIGAELPSGIWLDLPRWGMLQLHKDGFFAVHEPTFQAHLTQARERVQTTHSILTQVNLYNANLRFLTGALGLSLDLGDLHRASANDGLRRFQGEFFGPNLSIFDGLRETIRERYSQDAHVMDLPESWLYWPITAGGMSLRNASVLMGQYNEAYDERKKSRLGPPVGAVANWQRDDEAWGKYYQDLLKTLKPVTPKDTAVMKTLVNDFINRGAEISGGKQTKLSDYWRWVLYLYGPEILDRFGTFRFLITDLVPLQLIQEQLLWDGSLSGAAAEKAS